MFMATEEIFDSLVESISSMKEVQSIGISGGKRPFPKASEGDIDVFIYCDSIPLYEERQSLINKFGYMLQESKINVFEGGHWGVGDVVIINGVETWFMYFTTGETVTDVESILDGRYPDKLDNYYYPVGRCAMLKNIDILLDKDDFLLSLKEKLAQYPEKLATILTEHHLKKLEDREDLERAVLRKDVLFYHFAIDLAIDNFLQALFALNKTFFPSRKRSLVYINNFRIKPDQCGEKLLEVIKLGSFHDGISQSYEIWCDLIAKLKSIYEEID